MSLVTDRDLLVVEPSVFVDAAAMARVIAWTDDATIVGTGATVSGLDLESLGIGAGHVAVVESVAIEIVARTSATECDVSLPRAAEADEKVAPGDVAAVRLDVLTFSHLIDQIEQALLRNIGIDPNHPTQPLDDSAIVNSQAIQSLIVMRVLAGAFAGAAALQPNDASLAARRDLYTQRAGKALHAASCLIDLDGDGVADVVRYADTIQFRRG